MIHEERQTSPNPTQTSTHRHKDIYTAVLQQDSADQSMDFHSRKTSKNLIDMTQQDSQSTSRHQLPKNDSLHSINIKEEDMLEVPHTAGVPLDEIQINTGVVTMLKTQQESNRAGFAEKLRHAASRSVSPIMMNQPTD